MSNSLDHYNCGGYGCNCNSDFCSANVARIKFNDATDGQFGVHEAVLRCWLSDYSHIEVSHAFKIQVTSIGLISTTRLHAKAVINGQPYVHDYGPFRTHQGAGDFGWQEFNMVADDIQPSFSCPFSGTKMQIVELSWDKHFRVELAGLTSEDKGVHTWKL